MSTHNHVRFRYLQGYNTKHLDNVYTVHNSDILRLTVKPECKRPMFSHSHTLIHTAQSVYCMLTPPVQYVGYSLSCSPPKVIKATSLFFVFVIWRYRVTFHIYLELYWQVVPYNDVATSVFNETTPHSYSAGRCVCLVASAVRSIHCLKERQKSVRVKTHSTDCTTSNG